MARKQYSANFKAKVAVEAIKDESTMAQLSQKHGVHPTQVQCWKADLVSGAETIFLRGGKVDGVDEKHLAELERKIGQLTIENDFLKKNLNGYPKKSY